MVSRCIEAAGLKDGERLLDAGCGFGGTLGLIHQQFPKSQLTGLNIDERQIEFTRSRLPASARDRIKLFCGDACQLPFEAESFDVIVALELLCHLDDAPRFFSEARRTLKPDGRLIVADHVVSTMAKSAAKGVDLVFGSLFARLYGRLNCTRTIRDFITIAKAEGLDTATFESVTRHTLPNYRFLRRMMRGFDIPFAEKRLNDVISLTMEASARIGAFGYALMKFDKSD